MTTLAITAAGGAGGWRSGDRLAAGGLPVGRLPERLLAGWIAGVRGWIAELARLLAARSALATDPGAGGAVASGGSGRADPGVRGARAGGEAGGGLDVHALYRRYGDMVLSRCRTILRDEADAQDAAQEVFLKAHRYRDEFRGDASPATWLYRIATTTSLNLLRGRRRRPEDVLESPDLLPHWHGSALDQLETKQLLAHLLREQDERTRDCLIYHCVDGMTHDEVGALLGLSGAAVRKRISTFRNSLTEEP